MTNSNLKTAHQRTRHTQWQYDTVTHRHWLFCKQGTLPWMPWQVSHQLPCLKWLPWLPSSKPQKHRQNPPFSRRSLALVEGGHAQKASPDELPHWRLQCVTPSAWPGPSGSLSAPPGKLQWCSLASPLAASVDVSAVLWKMRYPSTWRRPSAGKWLPGSPATSGQRPVASSWINQIPP